MKIAPANQTYIPASNTGRQRFAVSSQDDASAQLGQALRSAISGTQLKSVTIVASRSDAAQTDAAESDDDVVVVQAQYASEQDPPSTALTTLPRQTSRANVSNRSSSYLSPVEQYTRTQSGESRSAPLVDVRA